MDPRDAELLSRLLPTFRLEAEDHLRRIEILLGALREEPSRESVQEAFREVHSLKGAARAVGARELEALCQEMEAVFAGATKGALRLERGVLDLLYLAADLASDMARVAGKDPSPELGALAAEATRRLAEAARGQQVEPPEEIPRQAAESFAAPRPTDTLRIGTEKIEQVLIQAEELLGSKLAAREQKEAIGALLRELGQIRRSLSLAAAEGRALQRSTEGISPESPGGRSPILQRLVGLLAEGEDAARTVQESTRRLLGESEEHFRFVATKVDALLAAVRETLMLPVGSLLESLPRMVRELARESGKGAELELSGGEIPVDRRILEEMRDPLQHLLRNAIDHGVEPADERQRRGKEVRGRIRLEVTSPSPRRVLFVLSDDGRGIDLSKVKEAAVREGVVSREDAEALDEWEIASLAFTAGLSTRESVTTVSGRGLGLSIVREKVERLGGEVHVSSRSGEGTTFRLEIPAAMAAFRGILTRLGQAHYIFPAVDVERVLRISPLEVRTLESREMVELEGFPLPVVPLEVPLELPLLSPDARDPLPLVLTHSRRGRVAFVVDEIISEQEFLIKGLGRQLLKVENFSGSAILGNGTIAFILDIEDLARRASGMPPTAGPAAQEPALPARKRVLVAEDSITARTLLRNILEGAGYAVTTAVDGMDALQRLASAVFDVVVSDVEMPRMDGFALTRKIRENYGRLPVILVTGLASQEDRERGIEAGADAYIVKSRFDQGNLLEVVGRLA
jgi:two-component system, chemotaxis family, sensor kinase CheA